MADTYVIIQGQQYLSSALDWSEVGQDRYFREALKVEGNKVKVDMTLAPDVHREHLRGPRNEELAALDITYMKELETGADSSVTIAEKNKLRDVTADPRIAAAVTPAELKALTLEVLTA